MIWIDTQNVNPRLNSRGDAFSYIYALRTLNSLQLTSVWNSIKDQFYSKFDLYFYSCTLMWAVFFHYKEVISFSIALNITSWLTLSLVSREAIAFA